MLLQIIQFLGVGKQRKSSEQAYQVPSICLQTCWNAHIQSICLFSWKETWRCVIHSVSFSIVHLQGWNQFFILCVSCIKFPLQIPNMFQQALHNEIIMPINALLQGGTGISPALQFKICGPSPLEMSYSKWDPGSSSVAIKQEPTIYRAGLQRCRSSYWQLNSAKSTP